MSTGKDLFDQFRGDTTLKGKALKALSRYNEGSVSHAVLSLGTVVDAETLTLGADVYQIVVVNTDTTVNVSGTWAATNQKLTASAAFPSQVVKGSVLRIENEFVKVLDLPSTTEAIVSRGFAGSTAASHADTTDIFRAATPATAGRLEIPSAGTLTAAAMAPLIAAAVNFWRTGYAEGLGKGTGVVFKNRLPVTAVVTAASPTNGVVFSLAGAAGTAASETLSNTTIDAVFGVEQEVATARQATVRRNVVTADAGAVIRIVLPFTPIAARASLYTSAGVLVLTEAASPTVALQGNAVLVTAGTTAFANGQYLIVSAYGV